MFSFFKRSRKSRNASQGPRRVRLDLEQLEERELMSASAFSNLGGVSVQFNLRDDGHLLMTQNQVQTDLGGGVQGLYQGHNSAGNQVAFDLANNHLNEFTPNQGWVGLGAADHVVTNDSSNLIYSELN